MRTPEEIRKEQNRILAGRVKAGEIIKATLDQDVTWWPPRPIIEKNLEDMKRAYDIKDDEDA
jgi:hypothetical protein